MVIMGCEKKTKSNNKCRNVKRKNENKMIMIKDANESNRIG